jgi:MarR family 2-MHQ and catechol resistance regulon transcriptional repressor
MARLRDKGVLAWLYMMRVTDKLHRLESENLAQFDLTPAKFGVLAHLSANDGITQQELSEMLFVTKGNVCGLIDRLEKDELVMRVSDPGDRRSNRLHLTPKGEELVRVVVPANERFIDDYMSVLSSEEQDTLRSLLRRLDKSLTEDILPIY